MKNVLLLCGGRSAEHEISLRSAKTVLQSLDPKVYNVHVVGVTREGLWVHLPNPNDFLAMTQIDKPTDEETLCGMFQGLENFYLCIREKSVPKKLPIHVAFSMLHGPYGEDGTVQGLFDMMGVAYVGSGVLASAVGMDKVTFKSLMKQEGIPVVPSLSAASYKTCPSFEEAVASLGSTLFIKPSVMGSSVGVSKVSTAEAYDKAVKEAFTYSSKILIEKAIVGQELECAVLGNDPFNVSDMCEIKSHHDFYSYEAKYLDPNGATAILQADVTPEVRQTVKQLSAQVASLVGCRGMARVDFLIEKDHVYVNEVNTVPGFTSISMYPQLWEQQGVSLPQLCHQLIEYAFEEHQLKQKQCLVPIIPASLNG